MAGSMMSWSKCSEESVACIGQGTRNEGWYSFKKDSVKKILPLACSEDI